MNANDITMFLNALNELKAMVIEVRETIQRLSEAAEKELLTPKEVCAELKISRDTYQRYVKNGLIAQIDIGKAKRVKRQEIDRLLAEGKV